MFGIGWTEFVVIAFVLLIFVGPRQLPAVFKKAGQIIGELKAASRDLKNQVSSEVREIEEGLRAASKDLKDDIEQELDLEVGSPYDAVYRGEAALERGKAALKNEIQSLKESVEQDDSPTLGKDAPTDDKAVDEAGVSAGSGGRPDGKGKAP